MTGAASEVTTLRQDTNVHIIIIIIIIITTAAAAATTTTTPVLTRFCLRIYWLYAVIRMDHPRQRQRTYQEHEVERDQVSLRAADCHRSS